MGKKNKFDEEKEFDEINSVNDDGDVIEAKKTLQKILPNNIKYRGKNKSQVKLINSIRNNEITICAGPPGTGKTFVSVAYALALLRKFENRFKKIYLIKSVTTLKGEEVGFLKGPQPIYEKVLTPNGWISMGDLNIGDLVITDEGDAVKISNIKEFGVNDIYRLKIKDGRFVDCDLDHLWQVRTKKLDFFNVTTKFILDNIKNEDFYLPRLYPVQFNNNKLLKIHPYLLGVLIGDGSFTHSHVRFSNIDNDIIKRVKVICDGYNIKLVKNNISYNLVAPKENSIRGAREMKIIDLNNNKTHIGYLSDIKKILNISEGQIINRCNNNSTIKGIKYEYTGNINTSNNIVRQFLIDNNLFKKRSWEKHIPDDYLKSSIEDRFELLRGLLDTDGTIKKNGEITYVTTSKKLSENIKELVLSLGGSARIYEPKTKKNNQILNNHVVKQRRQIYTVYIKFFNDLYNPFYLKRKADRFKTLDDCSLKITSIEKINKSELMKCITLDNKKGLYVTKDYLVTHNSLEDKIEPFMWSYFINMEKIITPSTMRNLLNSDFIRPFPLAYMRGASLDDCIIIADEMQNISIDNSRTLLTRIGSNCKLIILGDTNQIDMKNKKESSLEKLLHIFENVDKIGVINMSTEDTNVRNPLIEKIEEKYNEYYDNK